MEAGQPTLRWYQGLDRYCWVVLIVAALGWMFDTMDQNIWNLVRNPSLEDLLRGTVPDGAPLKALAKQRGGEITALFLIGWSVGGFIFGILGDRIGRTGTMIATILIYAIFTGLSGAPFVQSWELYAFFRFMTAVGVGGEWAAGAALVAEVFPDRARPMALGLLQALSAVGNMMAAVITMNLGDLTENWRIAYFIGAVPALLVLWIRSSVKEPQKWQEAKASAALGKELGNIGELVGHPTLRRNLIAAVLMATAGVGGLWGIGFFSTDLLREELTRGNLPGAAVGSLVSWMFLLQNLGAFFGILLFAALAEKTSRRGAFFLWFGLAWLGVLAYFWGIAGSGAAAFTRALVLAPILGFCTLGPFSGYTVYFPELFPTRLRATVSGVGYNAARILAALAPMALGNLSATLGGFAPAASVVAFIYLLGFLGTAIGPETKGKPLPE
jgi:MFS family permease